MNKQNNNESKSTVSKSVRDQVSGRERKPRVIIIILEIRNPQVQNNIDIILHNALTNSQHNKTEIYYYSIKAIG